MLTLDDILAEVRRLTGKQTIGISAVGDLININDGSGQCVTVRLTPDMTTQQFGKTYLEARNHVK